MAVSEVQAYRRGFLGEYSEAFYQPLCKVAEYF